MISKLKQSIYEAERPIGVKKYSNWVLPPPEFAYGLPLKKDKEDAGVSKINH